MAEKTKEEGNVAFKACKYQAAVDLYTKAIGKRRRSLQAPDFVKDYFVVFFYFIFIQN